MPEIVQNGTDCHIMARNKMEALMKNIEMKKKPTLL